MRGAYSCWQSAALADFSALSTKPSARLGQSGEERLLPPSRCRVSEGRNSEERGDKEHGGVPLEKRRHTFASWQKNKEKGSALFFLDRPFCVF
jgi:hypothetical protein